MGIVWWVTKRFVRLVSAEWIVERYSNGGDVIAARAVWVATAVTIAYSFLSEVLRSDVVWGSFDPERIVALAHDGIPTFGAVFAVSYAALYARFSAQWSYLASLHNQIMASAMGANLESRRSREVLAKWKAGFIEDAEELHLVLKPMFAVLIFHMLKDEEVQRWYRGCTPAGEQRINSLRASVARVYEAADVDARKRLTRGGSAR